MTVIAEDITLGLTCNLTKIPWSEFSHGASILTTGRCIVFRETLATPISTRRAFEAVKKNDRKIIKLRTGTTISRSISGVRPYKKPLTHLY